MEEAKALQQQQQLQQLQLQHQQQQQQQFMMFQQLQMQQHQQQQQQQQQAAAISRFPSSMDAHLRPIRPFGLQPNPNPNPNPNPGNPVLNLQHQNPNSSTHGPHQQPQLQQQQMQQQQQQKASRPPGNQLELQMAYQDAWRVCHPDFKRPFSSLEDACQRLLPYHVVADYEAEEDDRLLDSDTTGKVPSRSQQWENNITAKISEFAATFEKQVLALNIISQKRAVGEFRSEERLMIEQALLQEEKRAMFELRAELESREKAGREAHEAKLRMAAMVQAEQARADSQTRAEMMSRVPIRSSALGPHGNHIAIGHGMGEQDRGGNPSNMINGWGTDDEEPSDDFLNDIAKNVDIVKFDLNSR